MRFGSVPPRNWQKAHGTMISHEKSTNDISNIVNVIYGGMLALKLSIKICITAVIASQLIDST